MKQISIETMKANLLAFALKEGIFGRGLITFEEKSDGYYITYVRTQKTTKVTIKDLANDWDYIPPISKAEILGYFQSVMLEGKEVN